MLSFRWKHQCLSPYKLKGGFKNIMFVVVVVPFCGPKISVKATKPIFVNVPKLKPLGLYII